MLSGPGSKYGISGTASHRGFPVIVARWGIATIAVLIAGLVIAFDPKVLVLAAAAVALAVGLVAVVRIFRRRPEWAGVLVLVGMAALLLFLAFLLLVGGLQFEAPLPIVDVPVMHEVEATYEQPPWRVVESMEFAPDQAVDAIASQRREGRFEDTDPDHALVEAAADSELVAAGWEPGRPVGNRLIFRRERMVPVVSKRWALRAIHELVVALPGPFDVASVPEKLLLLPGEGSHMLVTAPQGMVLATSPPPNSRADLGAGLEQLTVPLRATAAQWVRDPASVGMVRVDTARGIIRLTRIGPLLARVEASGWWWLPATVLGLLLTAVVAVGREALAKAIWNWVAGAFRRLRTAS